MEKGYGILVNIGGKRKICNLIFQNSNIFKKNEEVFYTGRDKQENIEVHVYETEGKDKFEDVINASFIGKVILPLSGEMANNAPFLLSLCVENNYLAIGWTEDSWNTENKRILSLKPVQEQVCEGSKKINGANDSPEMRDYFMDGMK